MLSTQARPWIEATIPALLANGAKITQHFYASLFGEHPTLINLFNMSNQANGSQAQALAGAVYAYAKHMDNASVVDPVLERIAHKHISLGITPAQYTIVGRHLMAAIKAVLGDAVTPEIAAAWDEVYWLMASDLIAREARLYQAQQWQQGQDWPELEVVGKQLNSADCVTLTLKNPTERALPTYRAGQYISVAVNLSNPSEAIIAPITQIRQYSLVSAPHEAEWKITVKRVTNAPANPDGVVSNHLHDEIVVGDILRVGLPAGDFCLKATTQPVVLISAGVGITPMVSMLTELVHKEFDNKLVFAYASSDAQHYPHEAEVEQLLALLPQVDYQVWLESGEHSNRHTLAGRMDLSVLPSLPHDAQYYLCGPLPFMQAQRRWLLAQGIGAEQVHYEVFGPDLFGDMA